MTPDARSQFVANGGAPSQARVMQCSLALMVTDTRKGVDQATIANMAVLRSDAGAHPEKQTRLAGYEERFYAAAGGNDTAPAAVARAKPGSTMK